MDTTASTTTDLLAGCLDDPGFAKAVGRSLRTIKRWDAEGNGPPFFMVGGRKYRHVETAREWFLSRQKRRTKRR